MKINPFSIPPLLCSISIFFTGFFVFLKKPKAELNKSFFFLCLATTIWLSLYAINFTLSFYNPPLTYIIYKIAYCGVAFITITFLNFDMAFLQTPSREKWARINYLLGIFIAICILTTPFIVSGLNQFSWGLYPRAGTLHPFFLIYFIFLFIIADILLLKAIRSPTTPTIKRNQAKYIFFAYVLYTLASFDFLPNYGINVCPIGYIFATLFIIIVGYAAVKHNLMDLNIVIKKGLVYSILVATLTIIYLTCILILERIFRGLLGYRDASVSTLAAITIATIFTPLRNRIQCFIDRNFFKGTPIEIAEENEFLRKEVAQAEKFKAVATLASGIAHEIKNPLTAIKTFFEYLPDKKDDPEFLNKLNRIVGTEIDRVDQLVHQLLEFAKPSPLQLQRRNAKVS